MTELEIIKWVVFGLMGLAVWYTKRTIDDYEKRISSLEEEQDRIKSNYLHKDDFREFKQELRGMFEELKADIRSLQKGH